ncbi:lysine--tRNA ligase [Patescibacteria group bacterium]|nr:lysine--tRNA ligase [Patescibacteria group bacterium]
MFWADEFADKIIKSGSHKPYWVDDMKTPSGRVHVGALRGVIIHGLIHRALQDRKVESINTYVINDMDPMDGFPHYLPESFKKHMGEPLYRIPSPEKGYTSMARCYGEQFIGVFNNLGFKPKIIWSSEWYQAGKFDKVIREALDNVKKVRELYHKVSGYDKPNNWYPYQVICPKCGKVGTTIVTDWDGKEVSFECRKDLVKWAEGCGHKGKMEPVTDNGKLMWKVDWAAHWKTIGVTVEGAGKDHMTEGGSHDLSSAICEKVFDYSTPYNFLYEWFLAKGGVKMSSSRGVGTSAKEISETLPLEILNYLLVKTPYKKAIIFDPNNNDSILDLLDSYDEGAKIYYGEGVKNPTARAWQLSQVEKIPSEPVFLPRFRDVINYTQSSSINIYDKFEEIKGSKFSELDKKELDKRIKFANIWLKTYAPEEKKVGVVSNNVKVTLSDDQKKYLKLVIKLLEKEWRAEDLQQILYDTAKSNQIDPRKAFQAIYLPLTGKKHGPKAAWFLLGLDKKMMIERYSKAIKW